MFLNLDDTDFSNAVQPYMPALFGMGIPNVEQGAADVSVSDKNSLEKVQIRQKINEFQDRYEQSLGNGDLTPTPYSYTHHFSDIHSEFGCALYGRELTLTKGSIIIGKIHRHPVMNVLLKGKLVVVSENGRRTIEAPCVYVSEPNIKRVGYVIDDCIWLNVLLTKKAGEGNLDEIIDAHTANSYADVGLLDSTATLEAVI